MLDTKARGNPNVAPSVEIAAIAARGDIAEGVAEAVIRRTKPPVARAVV